MTPVDIWAAAAAFLAGSAIAIRGHMLRPHQRAWTHAPAAVWLCLAFLGITLLMAAVGLLFGLHASAHEAVIYTALAVTAVVMLWNLNRNGRLAHLERERIADNVRLVMDASGPPARYPWEKAG